MEFIEFPMDVQYCQFKIRPLTGPKYLIHLKWANDSRNPLALQKHKPWPNISMPDLDLLVFHVDHPSTGQDDYEWINGEKYDELYVNFTFERLIMATVCNIYIPSTLIVGLSWISFYLDVDAVPGRVSLGIMSVLTVVTQMHQAKSKLPPINYMTALDIWMLMCLLFVTLSMVEYAIAYANAQPLEYHSTKRMRSTPSATRASYMSKSNEMNEHRVFENPRNSLNAPFRRGSSSPSLIGSNNWVSSASVTSANEYLQKAATPVRPLIANLTKPQYTPPPTNPPTPTNDVVPSSIVHHGSIKPWLSSFGRPWSTSPLSTGDHDSRGDDYSKSYRPYRIHWLDEMSKKLFPICFTIFSVIYWACYLLLYNNSLVQH